MTFIAEIYHQAQGQSLSTAVPPAQGTKPAVQGMHYLGGSFGPQQAAPLLAQTLEVGSEHVGKDALSSRVKQRVALTGTAFRPS